MLHSHDDFLNAIVAQPTDRTLRLVFADWLDEQSDPRAELIRIEEEMRQLPVFADRFWELKPRRNELRTQVGTEWCERMRYGTECEPVFRHGIPDGWRERWRLIREFTERWHRVPMGDLGRRPKEIEEVEARLGRKLPPSVREWIAFATDRHLCDSGGRRYWNRVDLTTIDNGRAVLIASFPHNGVQIQDFDSPDPPVYTYNNDADDPAVLVLAGNEPSFPSVTAFCITEVLMTGTADGEYYLEDPDGNDAGRAAESFLPCVAHLANLTIHEGDGVIATFERNPRLRYGMMWLRISPCLDLGALPTALHDFIEERNRLRAAGLGDPIPF